MPLPAIQDTVLLPAIQDTISLPAIQDNISLPAIKVAISLPAIQDKQKLDVNSETLHPDRLRVKIEQLNTLSGL